MASRSAGWRNTPPRSDHRDRKLTFIPHVAKACKRLQIFIRLSPSGQGDVGSESGREDHIHPRVGRRPGYGEARKRLRDTFVDRELERPFRRLASPCARARDRVRGVETSTPRRWTVSRWSGRRSTPTEAVLRAKSVRLTEWRDGEGLVLDARLDPFCTVFQAEMVAAKSDTEVKMVGKGWSTSSATQVFFGGIDRPEDLSPSGSKLGATSPRSLRRAGPCAYSGLERMPESRTSVRRTRQAPPSPKRRRTMMGFRCRTLKVIRAASLEGGGAIRRGSTGDITKCFFPQWKKRTGSWRHQMTSPWRRQVMVGSRSTCWV
ncbi:hypothetical protein EVAR_86899_1 [Eumeta japonica]|uniref:Uncharacterized protein n=1 Tax=Eumeta variegata TaxID=151549 RepID=A0A4C1W947_EUMVA|nr:hypothetical protein EVAR_86899_1 [Eumeta japonica]